MVFNNEKNSKVMDCTTTPREKRMSFCFGNQLYKYLKLFFLGYLLCSSYYWRIVYFSRHYKAKLFLHIYDHWYAQNVFYIIRRYFSWNIFWYFYLQSCNNIDIHSPPNCDYTCIIINHCNKLADFNLKNLSWTIVVQLFTSTTLGEHLGSPPGCGWVIVANLFSFLCFLFSSSSFCVLYFQCHQSLCIVHSWFLSVN